ncbi:hypothetical protein [Thalassolituus maritimus]|uniref:Uncharacterized protein n=1 Tax=Thalassolituus maritimus TaxID=484498 RepID=A0ABP9ZZ74_9GAMM
MIKELLKAISGDVRERASSPFLGAYTIVSIIINWKALVILFTSELHGSGLVEEAAKALLPVKTSIGYPLMIALGVSLGYPTLKAAISTFNIYARMLEIRAEDKLEILREDLNLKKDPIENLIRHINDHDYYEKIGYHDLKRLHDYLPDIESLLIEDKTSSKNNT